MRLSPRLLARLQIVGVLGLVAYGAAACSTAQTDRFVAGVDNFTRGLAAVDEAVKKVNASLYAQCSGLVTAAQAINDIAGSCSKASNYTSVANVVIVTYCQTSGVEQNGVAKSLAVTASGVNAAKSTLAANKKACSS